MSKLNNRVQLCGFLGRDPETRRLGSGDPVVNLRLATSDRWNDKASGEQKERTEWHSVVIYNEHLCRVAEQYLRKGAQVLVAGSLRTRKWQDQSGTEKYTTEVVLDRFGGDLMLLGKTERPAAEPESYGTTRSREAATAQPSAGSAPRGYPDLNDDIPF